MQTAAYSSPGLASHTNPIANSADLEARRPHDPYHNMSDGDIIARCKAHDSRAFDALLSRYGRYIHSVAIRLAGNNDDANDLVSETNLRIFRYIGEFQHAVTLPAWIKRVMTNVFLDHRRYMSRRPATSLDSLVGDNGDGVMAGSEAVGTSPHLTAETNERNLILNEAILALPAPHREIVSMYHAEERSYEEIAAQMNLPVGTVKSRLNRARAALRQSLEPQRALLS
jgi:RNA polymerase sigma-70 factor (ECF subfamily)